ncbi:DUF6807 domain-containing protein [Telluribacter humicola]|uniref:DUF6807 domain-containing protein n=1 Tax=Telluribacter humicola TaxID=1720261 RepID=UPI001A958772|nr:PmoA family protein [Telluribacter humicola]
MKNLIFFLLFATVTPLFAQVAVLEINAGNHDRYQTPVHLQVNKPLATTRAYYLQKPGSKKKLPAQAVDAHTLFFILDSLPAGTRVTYHLVAGQATPSKNSPQIEKKPEGVQVRVGNKPVFFYQAQEVLPPNTPSHYSRSGFIHPLYSPAGQVLTDDFPVGHTHQHALFAAWVNTTFKNSFVDFWNQHLKKGTIEHVQVLDTQQGPVAAQLKTELRYKSLEFGEVLREVWTVTVYPFTDYFLFDIEQLQTNTSADTLHINKYTYGGMAFRGSREWNRTDSAHYSNRWHILTDQNKTLADANHTHARWVDASGQVDGKMTGLTVFGFPSNHRYPQAIRVHPDMPYWCYSPMVDGAFDIAPGASYQNRYRYYVHNGSPDPKIIKQIQTDITEPIMVNIINR